MFKNDKKNNNICASVEDLDYSGLPLNRAKLSAEEVEELAKELGLDNENLDIQDNDSEEIESFLSKQLNHGGF